MQEIAFGPFFGRGVGAVAAANVGRTLGFGIVVMLGLAVLAPVSARATFPGQNGELAFAAPGGPGEEQGIYSSRTDGTGLTRLSPSDQGDNQPSWSPDGSKIAFETINDETGLDIGVMNADGSGRTLLMSGPSNDFDPSWSPRGDEIVFERLERDDASRTLDVKAALWVMKADGSSARRLTVEPLTSHGYPKWSPDARTIIFTRGGQSLGPPAVPPVSEIPDGIWSVGTAGLLARPIVQELTGNDQPDWSPDGRRIAFKKSGAGIVIADANGGSQQVAVSGDATSFPVWSPDGSKLAYDGPGGLTTASTDGSNPNVVAPFGFLPSWRPVAPIPAPPPPCSVAGIPTDPLCL